MNFANPILTTAYADFLAQMKERDTDLARMFDPAVVTTSGLPDKSVRWSSAANKWQKLDFATATWSDLSAAYAINISGNAATATTLQTARTINGVSFNGSANINVNTNQVVTFNNLGTGSTSGASFNGSSGVTVSYNTIGAPSTAGLGATGTWGINISGTAATATILQTARTINGVSFNGSANINVNNNYALTISNAGDGVASGITFNGGTARTISYNSVGAPSVAGAGATGTWGISISGSAANLSAVLLPEKGGTGLSSVGAAGTVLTSTGSGFTMASVSAAVGSGTDKIFYENDKVVNSSYTITTGKNAMSAGPILIETGVSVVVPTGSVWSIV